MDESTMTFDQLMGMSAAELEAIPQKDMEAYFEPYLQFSRPERAALLEPERKRKPQHTDAYDRAKEILQQKLGINLDEI